MQNSLLFWNMSVGFRIHVLLFCVDLYLQHIINDQIFVILNYCSKPHNFILPFFAYIYIEMWIDDFFIDLFLNGHLA